MKRPEIGQIFKSMLKRGVATIRKHSPGSIVRALDTVTLGAYARNWLVPRNLPAIDTEYFVPSRIFTEHGLDYNTKTQLQYLVCWREAYQPIFRVLRADPQINTQCLGKEYLHNGYYPTPDAEVYAAMILDHRPSHIVEVGSGFSTLVARRTIEAGKLDCTIQVIDPAPRTDVKGAADSILLDFVEDVDVSDIKIAEGNLLFIDSSHICRGLGDIPYLFCKLIPRLPPGVLVHVHDIFLPYEYPVIYLKWLYTEQYLLYALLADSPRYEVVFSTHYMSRKHPEEMQATFGSIIGSDTKYLGASFWFRTK